jgi:hypothetical protein
MDNYIKMQARGRAMLVQHSLDGWQCHATNLRHRPDGSDDGDDGSCDHEEKLIRVDFHVGRDFRQVMLHEIAHALVGPGQRHGQTWRDKALAIGCTSTDVEWYEIAEACGVEELDG